MARFQLTAAMLVVAGTMGAMAGCEGSGRTGGVDPDVKSTYGNITDHDRDAWGKPAPKPAPAPAPAPAPVTAKPMPQPQPQVAGNCMYLPTGDRASSSLSICCKMPPQVIAGQNFTYELEVCNLTGIELQNVVVVYTLDGAKIVTSDPPITGTGFGVGNLKARECRAVKVTANAAGTGSVKGCTSASWTNALCCSTNVVQPALKITKAVTPSDITVCDSVTYTITVENTGTGDATNVKVTDNLPAGVASSDGKSNLSWDAGTLGSKQSRTFTFQAKPSKTGSYVNNATAMADLNLSAKSNDVSFTARQAVLSITKACPQQLRIGQPATFKIVVTNTSDTPATNVVVEDTIPGGASFVSATESGAAAGNVVRWNIGTLAPRASKEVTVTMRNAGVGSINNVAKAMATCADAVSANCSTSFIGSPDIGTLVTDTDGVVLVGDNHEYQCEVKNQGQVPLTNAEMTVTLPAGMQYISSSGTPKVAGNKLTFGPVTLAPGQIVRFSFVVKATTAGEKLVTGETTCAELKTPVRDDELTNFVDR